MKVIVWKLAYMYIKMNFTRFTINSVKMILKQKSVLLIVGILTLFHGEVSSKERIIGGVREKETIPYQISLQAQINSGITDNTLKMLVQNSSNEWRHFCGGSIISEWHVLTAAHCLEGVDYKRLSVLAGTSSRTQGGHRHSIQWYTNHPNYTKLHSNDISIITVDPPFSFGPTLNKIDFRSTEPVGAGVKVRISGWGYTTPRDRISMPVNLRSTDLETIANDQCLKYGFNVTNTEICTLSNQQKGSCLGDSGGPLVNDHRTIVIGILSYGLNVCGNRRPEAYTRVSELVSWIEEQIM